MIFDDRSSADDDKGYGNGLPNSESNSFRTYSHGEGIGFVGGNGVGKGYLIYTTPVITVEEEE